MIVFNAVAWMGQAALWSRRVVLATGPSLLLLSNEIPLAADKIPLATDTASNRIIEPATASFRKAPEFVVQTKLGKSRFLTTTAATSPIESTLTSQWTTDPDVFYPTFFFGAWNVTSTMVQLLPSRDNADFARLQRLGLLEDIDDDVVDTFELHYFSTLANTLRNQAIVNLGLGVPQSKIIADRAFNILPLYRTIWRSTSTLINSALPEILWDYRQKPSHLAVTYATTTSDDTQNNDGTKYPVPRLRVESAVTSRHVEYSGTASDPAESVFVDINPVFAVVECSRVTIVPADDDNRSIQPISLDMETVGEFHLVSENFISALYRVVIYGSPSKDNNDSYSSLSRALPFIPSSTSRTIVAQYDFTWSMSRILLEFPSSNGIQKRPCVTTPNDIIQCY